MPKLTRKHALLYFLPLLAVAGPFLALGASNYLTHREDLQRMRNLQRVRAMPDAVVEATEYDFGSMDPLADGRHAFVIRNQGGGPLELSLGEPSSASIRGEIAPSIVPPGQAGEVRVSWTTGASQPEYHAGVLVETNDTSHREIRLTVHGTVRVQIGAVPKRLNMPVAEPGQAASASTLVYSQVLPDLPPPRATCSIAGATCTVTPAAAETLETVQAKAGYQVTATLPADLPSGPFEGVLRIAAGAAPSGTQGPLVLEIPFSGRVLRRLAVYGVGVEEPGIVDLGIHPPGKVYQHRLLLKVRDEESRLNLVRAEFQPEFLRAAIAPAGTKGKDHLYHLDITIPGDAPECIYRGVSLGEMKLFFDHPRIPELALQLSLAVMRRR
ncbi:MAG: DUF1573 domain-containing protein [Pirellulaceae bacterium]|nr:DUF1573 domain-containing protein [Pirellulaceae bacterium]